jgi:hypothetical protein
MPSQLEGRWLSLDSGRGYFKTLQQIGCAKPPDKLPIAVESVKTTAKAIHGAALIAAT